MGKEKTGRALDTPVPWHPSSRDLEGRKPHMPDSLITIRMLAASLKSTIESNTGAEYGRYGRGRYGRCAYGARYGIYGSDYYDSCRYS